MTDGLITVWWSVIIFRKWVSIAPNYLPDHLGEWLQFAEERTRSARALRKLRDRVERRGGGISAHTHTHKHTRTQGKGGKEGRLASNPSSGAGAAGRKREINIARRRERERWAWERRGRGGGGGGGEGPRRGLELDGSPARKIHIFKYFSHGPQSPRHAALPPTACYTHYVPTTYQVRAWASPRVRRAFLASS